MTDDNPTTDSEGTPSASVRNHAATKSLRAKFRDEDLDASAPSYRNRVRRLE